MVERKRLERQRLHEPLCLVLREAQPGGEGVGRAACVPGAGSEQLRPGCFQLGGGGPESCVAGDRGEQQRPQTAATG
jgi:hypothetical protein